MAEDKKKTEEGMFSFRGKQWDDALELPKDNPRRYLRAAGAAAGLFGDALAYPIEALTPQVVEDAASWAMSKAVQSPPGQYLVNLAKENPEIAKDIGALVNILGVIPAFSMVAKGGARAVPAMTKAVIENQSMVGKGKGLLKGAAKGLPPAAMDVARNMNTHQRGGVVGDLVDVYRTLTPEGREQVRSLNDIRTGQNKFIGSGIPFYPNGPISTAGEALTAIPGTIRESLSPADLALREATGMSRNSWKEMDRLVKDKDFGGLAGTESMQAQMALQSTGKMPDRLSSKSPMFQKSYYTEPLDINADLEPIKKIMFNRIPDDIAEQHMNHIRTVHRVNPEKQTNILMKRPEAQGIGREFAGASKTSAPILRGFQSGKFVKTMKNVYQTKELTPENMIELHQIGASLTTANKAKMAKAMGNKNPPKTVDLLSNILRGRKKLLNGEKLTKTEAKYLKAWDDAGIKVSTIKDQNGNVISNKDLSQIKAPEDGKINMTGSFLSSNKELGGVNYIMTTDLNNMKSFITGSDASDLFGIEGPKDASNLLIAVPTQVINHTSGSKYKLNVNRTTSKGANLMTAIDDLEAVYPELGTRNIPGGATIDALRMMQRDLMRKPVAPQGRHYGEALNNAIQQGLFYFQADTEDDEY